MRQHLLAAFLFPLMLALGPRVQITEPLPGQACYAFDEQQAHVAWITLDDLPWTILRSTIRHERHGNTLLVAHELVLTNGQFAFYLPLVTR